MDDLERRELAAFVIHAQLAGRILPERMGDVPERMIVDRIAREDAKEVLALLREIYGVEWWTKEEFQRAFVEGALAGWRPGALVQRKPDALRIVSTTCPVASEVERDARVCETCRALQRHAAYLALRGQVAEVRFERLMSKGESACEARIELRP